MSFCCQKKSKHQRKSWFVIHKHLAENFSNNKKILELQIKAQNDQNELESYLEFASSDYYMQRMHNMNKQELKSHLSCEFLIQQQLLKNNPEIMRMQTQLIKQFSGMLSTIDNFNEQLEKEQKKTEN